MNKILHITNGGHAKEKLEGSGLEGDILPWDDILHCGPVPEGLALRELSKLRAEYISGLGYDTFSEIHKIFQKRDETIESAIEYSEITLWFEPDLYDQLQILQVLDSLGNLSDSQSELYLIHFSSVTGVDHDDLKELYRNRISVSEETVNGAKKGWHAFRSASPQAMNEFIKTDIPQLPYLAKAFMRIFEEYPAYRNGLSGTMHQTLQIIKDDRSKGPFDVFLENQKQEDYAFLGNHTFFLQVDLLANGQRGLAKLENGSKFTHSLTCEKYSEEFLNQRFEITEDGIAVLNAKADFIELNGIDHHIGGVHLTSDNDWRWDGDDGEFKRKSDSR